MSYIEKKYLDNIKEIFDQLTSLDKKVLELITHKSVKHGDEVAKICGDINKKVNTILGKYYPEIKDMNDKLEKLINDISAVQLPQRDKLLDMAKKTGKCHKQLTESIGRLQGSLDVGILLLAAETRCGTLAIVPP